MRESSRASGGRIFGPVPSRRLGRSLGIDLVPFKVCTLDCVYCEVGPTNDLTIDRREYVPLAEVERELAAFVANHGTSGLDHLTLSGNGEPTLHSRLGEAIAMARRIAPGVPVAVITNGTLLWMEDVRRELMGADLVLPSLDALTPQVMAAVNRHHPSLTPGLVLSGLAAFAAAYRGRLQIEVLVVDGLNDGEEEIGLIGRTLAALPHESVYLHTLDRPSAAGRVRPVEADRLERLGAILTGAGVRLAGGSDRSRRGPADGGAIVSMLSLRAVETGELERIVGLPLERVLELVRAVRPDARVEFSVSGGRRFVRLA